MEPIGKPTEPKAEIGLGEKVSDVPEGLREVMRQNSQALEELTSKDLD